MCNEDFSEVSAAKKKGKKSCKTTQDRSFFHTTSTEIDDSMATWKALKLGKIKIVNMKNKGTILQQMHNCVLLPTWLDERFDPEKPHIRHLLFRTQACPGSCDPCWNTWPPQFFKCVNNAICGEWVIARVDLSYQKFH